MELLKELVHKLENEYSVNEQIKLLQTIEQKLLTEYTIVIGNSNIEPLRVEAYYYPFNEKMKFNDPCVHKSTKKINNFGKLYFIEERYGYPGIDICLSLGNYYLSFLIKNSRIGDQLYKQVDLFNRFQSNRHEIESMNALKHVNNNNKTVFFTSRVGLNKVKTKFAHELLAAVVEINNGISYDWERGYAKEWTVAYHMASNGIPATDENIKNLLGYRSITVQRKVNELCKNKNKLIQEHK